MRCKLLSPRNEYFGFDIEKMISSEDSITPPRISCFGMKYLKMKKKLFIFGGMNTNFNPISMCYSFDIESNKWEIQPSLQNCVMGMVAFHDENSNLLHILSSSVGPLTYSLNSIINVSKLIDLDNCSNNNNNNNNNNNSDDNDIDDNDTDDNDDNDDDDNDTDDNHDDDNDDNDINDDDDIDDDNEYSGSVVPDTFKLNTNFLQIECCAYTLNNDCTKLYMFGGSLRDVEHTNHLLEYDIQNKKLSVISQSSNTSMNTPSARYSAVIVCRDHGRKLVIFGGNCPQGSTNDMWEFDLQKKEWNRIQYENINQEDIPKAVDGHCALLLDDDTMLTMMGNNGDESVKEACLFYFPSRTWTKLHHFSEKLPSVSYHCAVLVDMTLYQKKMNDDGDNNDGDNLFKDKRAIFIYGGWHLEGQTNKNDLYRITWNVRTKQVHSMQISMFSYIQKYSDCTITFQLC